MILDEVKKYFNLVEYSELRALYEDDFQFEVLKNEDELENHIYDLDDDEKERIRNAVSNELKNNNEIVFYTSESAGEVYSSVEDFLVYLLNEILYQKLLIKSERKTLSNNFMELEISIKKLLILIWTR
ncbi:hypothetical protein JQ824_09740 [Brachyspira hyodysenteriae]|uniref:Uncharacterized protein n=2 Tax=Brachyspira hyodysenteriae TaxID=159 RepID=A0A3B6VA18_BRAHW|nr:hypothetical protein [Brachyspira hyodysenteriae]ACN84089.1 hypothetical protein BHWA1_01619 [Brachyspira hyodysenteriae WA1]ANN63805.1 hypothetical protein BHYOB78_07980 [Brachyspira hyodysenteriae ATCC 27164]AUJ49819.1 hypothetical protein BH718_01378 [Brachyspira hyodysenteriae]KLI16588.1 hypothetical protein SU45_06825 [Brachyspira hyodysenteriae]KLI19414.1 hypothetical protein SU44_00200 [Brachyspira hyodysenteriae]